MKRTPLKRKTALKRSVFKSKGKSQKNKKKPTGNKNKRRRTNKNTITWHKKKLWKLFSKYIRERDNYTCFTCGKHATGSGMHAAHFITGATCPISLYFDERNVHAGCYHCNINLSGNWVVYEEKMIHKYGQDVVDELKKNRTHLIGERKEIPWYQEKIKHYEKELSK